MKTISYFAVMENTDKTEGRGLCIPTGIGFEREEDALDFVASPSYAKYATMGVPPSRQWAGAYVNRIAITVFDDLDECEIQFPELEKIRKRKKALAKLTDEERALLGL